MFDIEINTELMEKLPQLRLIALQASVRVFKQDEALDSKIESDFDTLRNKIVYSGLSQQVGIQKGRAAYRALGKDPTRYRLSSEKLLRRILKGEIIGGINTLVDISNALSALTQCPIGTFDAHKISRINPLIVDIGREGERYLTLSQLDLNLEGLVVVRDAQGAFGSTTSDSSRTSVDLETTDMFMLIYVFDDNLILEEIHGTAISYLSHYLKGDPLTSFY